VATRNQPLDNTTISAGGSVTSNPVSLEDEEGLTLQFEGDNNSTDLSFEIQGRVDSLDSWSELDTLNNQDLTTKVNNNQLTQYDVLDLEELKVKATNNSADATDLKIVTSHTDQQ